MVTDDLKNKKLHKTSTSLAIMSLKAFNLLAQRNKFLVFGYCRENEKRHDHNVYPLAIIHLCLGYTFAVCDKFQETDEMDPAVEVRPDEIIGRAEEQDSQFASVGNQSS